MNHAHQRKVTLCIPTREGARPNTHYAIPHHQIDQIPSAEIYDRLLEGFLETPNTTHGRSLISVPGAQALFLSQECSCNADIAAVGREFAHVHPPSDGSFHMFLSLDDCMHVLKQGWGELHPLAAKGEIPLNAVMIYAPRTEAEIDIVLDITRAALNFASTPTTTTTLSREGQAHVQA